jgi:hypothetical protein
MRSIKIITRKLGNIVVKGFRALEGKDLCSFRCFRSIEETTEKDRISPNRWANTS